MSWSECGYPIIATTQALTLDVQDHHRLTELCCLYSSLAHRHYQTNDDQHQKQYGHGDDREGFAQNFKATLTAEKRQRHQADSADQDIQHTEQPTEG